MEKRIVAFRQNNPIIDGCESKKMPSLGVESIVYKYQQDNQDYVIKIFRPNAYNIQIAEQLASILSELNTLEDEDCGLALPLVGLYDRYVVDYIDTPFFVGVVTKYFDHEGTLLDLFSIDKNAAMSHLKKYISKLIEFRNHGIYITDVNFDNVLYNGNKTYIIDIVSGNTKYNIFNEEAIKQEMEIVEKIQYALMCNSVYISEVSTYEDLIIEINKYLNIRE